MTAREQTLVTQLKKAHRRCSLIEREIDKLRMANAELRIEREAADVLLGYAIDLLKRWLNGEPG